MDIRDIQDLFHGGDELAVAEPETSLSRDPESSSPEYKV
jgi:hypothetical protein